MMELARAAVRAACVVTRAVQRDVAGVRAILKDDKSPVTVADLASQAVVASTLARGLGPIALVGEEDAGVIRAELERGERGLLEAVLKAVSSVWPDATDDAVLQAIDLGNADPAAHPGGFFTLDPIDGTKGFLRGEQYAVSLAFIDARGPVLGVLGCPNLSADLARSFDVADAEGTLYAAERGRGALQGSAVAREPPQLLLRRGPLAPGARLRLCESVESGHTKHDASKDVMAALGEPGVPARLDSQAKYAVVARDQADVYLRMPTKKGYVERIWDHAAGCLIATEAGCTVSDVTGKALDFGRGRGLEDNLGVVVAPPEVHARLIAAIGALGLAARP